MARPVYAHAGFAADAVDVCRGYVELGKSYWRTWDWPPGLESCQLALQPARTNPETSSKSRSFRSRYWADLAAGASNFGSLGLGLVGGAI